MTIKLYEGFAVITVDRKSKRFPLEIAEKAIRNPVIRPIVRILVRKEMD